MCPRAPKTRGIILSIDNYKGVFCDVNELTFGLHVRMSVGCQWSQSSDWRIGTSCSTSSLREEEVESVFNGQGVSELHPCKEVAIKTQKDGVQRASRKGTFHSTKGVRGQEKLELDLIV